MDDCESRPSHAYQDGYATFEPGVPMAWCPYGNPGDRLEWQTRLIDAYGNYVMGSE
jgi:hypothetical protein